MAKKKVKRPTHPVSGLTDVQTRQRCKDAIRHVWRKTSRAKHIRDNRIIHPDPNSRFKYAVFCTDCNAMFGQSETTTYKAKSGRRRRTGAYQVDHICETGMPPVNDLIEDLGAYADAVLHTPLRIVCVPCHKGITAAQVVKKFKKE